MFLRNRAFNYTLPLQYGLTNYLCLPTIGVQTRTIATVKNKSSIRRIMKLLRKSTKQTTPIVLYSCQGQDLYWTWKVHVTRSHPSTGTYSESLLQVKSPVLNQKAKTLYGWHAHEIHRELPSRSKDHICFVFHVQLQGRKIGDCTYREAFILILYLTWIHHTSIQSAW